MTMTYTYDATGYDTSVKPVDSIGMRTNMTYDTAPHTLKKYEPEADEPTVVLTIRNRRALLDSLPPDEQGDGGPSFERRSNLLITVR